MFGEGGIDRRYLGSGDEDGLVSMDLGIVIEVVVGFRTFCRGFIGWVLFRWVVVGIAIVYDSFGVVLGFRSDIVIVVSILFLLEVG